METFPNEPINPPVWSSEAFDSLLKWAHEIGASDISLIPESPAFIRLHGSWIAATQNFITSNNIEEYLAVVSESSATSSILSRGKDRDFSYDLLLKRPHRLRFRVNATSCKTPKGDGCNLIFRSIPTTPPKAEELGLEEDLLSILSPEAGIVLVAGTMGSGKTTLLASYIRRIRERENTKFTVTYEHPVEFDLTSIPGDNLGPLLQTDIPSHLVSFDLAPKNATRRAIDVALVGESRDLETFRGICRAAELGTRVYTTVHTKSVAETLKRIILNFPMEERSFMYASLVSNVETIVYQTLVPKVGGGRVAVREWLNISRSFRRKLMVSRIEDTEEMFHDEIQKQGTPILGYAKSLYDKRIIGEDTYLMICKKHDFEGANDVAQH